MGIKPTYHVPTQGMENLEFTSWPVGDEWPKENKCFERKEAHFTPKFTPRRSLKTTDFKVQLPLHPPPPGLHQLCGKVSTRG